MSADECEHGGDPHTCPPCQRAAGRLPSLVVEAPAIEFYFNAKFDGDCSDCHTPIYVGQSCVHLSDGRNVHTLCTRHDAPRPASSTGTDGDGT